MRLSTRETVNYGEIWFTALFASTTFGNPFDRKHWDGNLFCLLSVSYCSPARTFSRTSFSFFFSVVNSNKCRDTQEDNASTKFLLLLALLGKSFLRWVIALGMRKERWKVEISPHQRFLGNAATESSSKYSQSDNQTWHNSCSLSLTSRPYPKTTLGMLRIHQPDYLTISSALRQTRSQIAGCFSFVRTTKCQFAIFDPIMPFNLDPKTNPSHRSSPWSESSRLRMKSTARRAIDIKLNGGEGKNRQL